MAWGSKTDADQLTNITNALEQEFNQLVTLAPTESAHVQISSTGSPGGTDGLDIKVYSTLEDTDAGWDTVPVTAMQLTDDADGEGVSLILSGIYRFKVGVISSGATDTHIADMSYRIGTP